MVLSIIQEFLCSLGSSNSNYQSKRKTQWKSEKHRENRGSWDLEQEIKIKPMQKYIWVIYPQQSPCNIIWNILMSPKLRNNWKLSCVVWSCFTRQQLPVVFLTDCLWCVGALDSAPDRELDHVWTVTPMFVLGLTYLFPFRLRISSTFF